MTTNGNSNESFTHMAVFGPWQWNESLHNWSVITPKSLFYLRKHNDWDVCQGDINVYSKESARPALPLAGTDLHPQRKFGTKVSCTSCDSKSSWVPAESEPIYAFHTLWEPGSARQRERGQVAAFHCSRLGSLSSLCGKLAILPSRVITRKLKISYQWRFSRLPEEHTSAPSYLKVSRIQASDSPPPTFTFMHRITLTNTHKWWGHMVFITWPLEPLHGVWRLAWSAYNLCRKEDKLILIIR